MQLDTTLSHLTPYPTGAGLKLGRSECLALSQLAALQGHVMSYREFQRLAQKLDRQRLSGVTLAGQLAALWSARFPQGRISAPPWPPKPTDIPALWIGPTPTKRQIQIMVVLGTQANGGLSCLDERGKTKEIPAATAHQGHLLLMEARLRSQAPSHPPRPGLRLSPRLISGLIAAALLTLLNRR